MIHPTESTEARVGGAQKDRDPAPTEVQSLLSSVSIENMLEGLARAHALVMALDEERRIVWISHDLGHAIPASDALIGRPVGELSEALHLGNPSAFREKSVNFVDSLRSAKGVAASRFDIGTAEAPVKIDVRGFEVRTDSSAILRVIIAYRLAPDAPIAPDPVALDANSKLALILDSTPDGVITIDRLGFVSSANAAAARLLGREVDEIVNRPFSIFPAEKGVAADAALRISEGKSIESQEIEIRRLDGSTAWISLSAQPHTFHRTDGSHSIETIVVLRDVTERHESRLALELKNEELENYVRSVSHDLRSPLASLLGFSRLLREDHGDALDAKGMRFLTRIEEAGRNMECLLHDMLELSRIGSASKARGPVDPRPVLLQLRTELKLRLDEKSITLEIPEDPPPVRCDRTRLYQLFSNLIGNAVGHLAPDGKRSHPRRNRNGVGGGVHHRERQRSRDRSARPRARLQDVHDPRARAMRDDTRTHSTGLGLAIVKKIVEANAGRVHVESSLGEGARFVIFLPDSEE